MVALIFGRTLNTPDVSNKVEEKSLLDYQLMFNVLVAFLVYIAVSVVTKTTRVSNNSINKFFIMGAIIDCTFCPK